MYLLFYDKGMGYVKSATVKNAKITEKQKNRIL